MLKITWLSDPEIHFRGREAEDPPPRIAGYRRAEHSDLVSLKRLIRPKTYDVFGDFELDQIFEMCCLCVIQYNEKQDIVSGICLCNYPNVSSVPACDWLTWIKGLYGVEEVTECNAMFVHFLVWDKRYAGHFFEDLLTALFDISAYCLHVILVHPPRVILADVFERQMIRIVAKGMTGTDAVQSIYISVRHLENPRLRIRLVVEEDNDDVIPIIHAESTRLTDFYGEYYISEMVRHPDGCRQLIVSEDEEGLATGVLCLNSTIDVDVLNQNFELGPYNGLRKSYEADGDGEERTEACTDESDLKNVTSPAKLSSIDSKISRKEWPIGINDVREDTNNDSKGRESQITFKGPAIDTNIAMQSRALSDINPVQFTKHKSAQSVEDSRLTFFSDIFPASKYRDRPKKRSTVFADTVFDFPRRSALPPTEHTERLSSQNIQDAFGHTAYHGEINAFVIEIFSTKKEIAHRRYKDFLEAAFERFPEQDYCAILLPSSHPFLPFLEHFVHVPLRCNRDFPMTLYLTHRAIFFGEIKSREATFDDRENVDEFLRGIPKKAAILTDFDVAIKSCQWRLKCYVFECNDVIVGIAILCAEEDPDLIRSHYHVEDYISTQNIPADSYGRVLHFNLMPIFFVHRRLFLREIMRLSGYTVLYHRLYESAASGLTRIHPLATCLNAMIPVKPRSRVGYEFRNHFKPDENEEKMIEEREQEPFALFMMTPRISIPTTTIINTKIVVVGASDCGMGFLEYLTLGSSQSYVYFANVTLISQNGLPFENKRSREESLMIPFRGQYCHEYRHLVATKAWINVIRGTMIGIHRKHKYVTVMNQGNLTYDYLVLTCGLQYQRPGLKGKKTRRKEETIDSDIPWNCLTVNDDTEAVMSLKKLRMLTNNFKQKKAVVFYGHNIDCYCALSGLIESGVPGCWITLIEPALNRCETHDNVFFNDCEVDTAIMNGVLRSKVSVLLGWNMIDWELKYTNRGNIITSITLESGDKSKIVPCDAFFNFDEKTINIKTFLAICRAGLVFDGQLVIDPKFRTNDPHIFAAGTMTKYSRKFYAESWEHKYYNSVEVGERLAKTLRKVIDIHESEEQIPAVVTKKIQYLTLPVFRASTIVACILPGGYRYLHVRKPGKKLLRKVAIRHECYGEVMVTGSCTSTIGYFRLRLNHYNTVETITCVNKKGFEVQHMIALYGKHESMLNELKLRFLDSRISDFYAYFEEPWANAIFYDKFECLRIENRATLLSKTIPHGDSLVDDCIRALIKSKWDAISNEDRRYIQSKYSGSIYHQEVEQCLYEFLQFFEEDLPMYCTPQKIRLMYADIEDSPLYTNL